MKKSQSLRFLPFAMMLLTACATAPHHEGRVTSGYWAAKAQAKDLIADKSYNLSLDITAVAPSSLRMDITGTLGINVATLAMQKNEIRYNLYRQKKYYEGRLSDRALLPLFKMRLNPRLLMNLCMDDPIEESGWDCKSDEKGLVSSCFRASDGLKVDWTDRDGDKKRVVVSDKNFELQILFKSYSELDPTKVQGEKNPFQLEAPKDFSRYKIP